MVFVVEASVKCFYWYSWLFWDISQLIWIQKYIYGVIQDKSCGRKYQENAYRQLFGFEFAQIAEDNEHALIVFVSFWWFLQLNMRPVVAVLLATLAGFGGSMCGASILIELLKLRGRWHSQLNQHSSSQQVTQPHQPPETSNIQQSTPPPENETGVPRI